MILSNGRGKKKQNRIATFADEILSLVIITRIRQLSLNRQIKENLIVNLPDILAVSSKIM